MRAKRVDPFLRIVIDLEGAVHPQSPAAALPRWSRGGLLKHRRARCVLRTVFIGLWCLAAFAPYLFHVDGAEALGAMVLTVVSLPGAAVGLAEDHPRITSRIISIERWVTPISYWGLGSLLAWFLFSVVVSEGQQRQNALGAVVGILMILRVVNALATPLTWARRRWRVVVGQMSFRALVVIGAVAVVSTLGKILASIDDDAHTPSVSIYSRTGFALTVLVFSLAALSKTMQRQRKVVTSLSRAVGHLDLLLGDRSATSREVLEASLEVDRHLATGSDTGVPMFATPFESETLRALLLAAVERVVDRKVGSEEWARLDQAREYFRAVSPDLCRLHARRFLARTRSQIRDVVDVAV